MRFGRIELGLMAVLAAATCAYVIRFHFPAPYYDHWDVAPMLEAAAAGALDPADLFAIHGGHWHASAYAVLLSLALLTGWSHLAESLVLLAVVAAAAFLLLRLGANFAAEAAPEGRFFGLAVIFLVFGLDQSANLVWNFQLSAFLCLLGAALSVGALAGSRLTVFRFLAAELGLALAVTSYATGFAVLPAGLLLIASRTDLALPRRALFAVVWLLIGVAWCAAFLLAQQHSPFGGFGAADDLLDSAFPAYLLMFEANYLGAAVRQMEALIVPVALLGPVTAGACAWLLLRCGVPARVVAAPLALCLFGIIAGLLCGAGRFEFGAGQGSNGRYATFAALYWLGLAWLVLATLARLKGQAWRRGLIAAVALCAVLKFASGVQAAIKTARITPDVAAVAEAMRADPAHAADAARAIAFDRQTDLPDYVAFIRERRWSVFASRQ
jgi:hypothetical protein